MPGGGAVVVLGLAHLRRRWLTLVAIGLLGGVVGGTVAAAAVAARRTATAYPRLVAEAHPPDALVAFFGDTDPTAATQLPQIVASWTFRSVVARLAGQAVTYISIGSGPPPPPGEFKSIVVRGRMPSAVNEVAVNADLPIADTIPLGQQYDLDLLTQGDFNSFGTFGEPHGPHVKVRVVGVARVGAVINVAALLATEQFQMQYAENAGGGNAVAMRLRRGVADVPDVQRELLRLYPVPPGAPADFEPFHLYSRANEAVSVARATRVAVRGLIAFAVVAGAAGMVALLQAGARYAASEASEQPTLAALGATGQQRLGGLVIPAVVLSGAVAAAVTVIGGALLSALGPIGSARRLEPHPGIAVNVGLIVVCVTATVAVVGLCLLFASSQVTRRVRRPERDELLRPSPLVGRLVRAGSPPPAVVGSRFALEPGGGSLAVPARTALVASVLGVLGVVGAAAVAGSLHRLTTTPQRYGAPGDAVIADVTPEVVKQLTEDHRLSSVISLQSGEALINGHPVSALSVVSGSGGVSFPVLQGRLPAGSGEIAIGPSALARVRAHVDGSVSVGEEAAGHKAVVVGSMLAISDTEDTYDDTAVVPPELFDTVKRSEGFRQAYVSVAQGQDRAKVLAELGRTLEVDDLTTPPTSIGHLAQLRGLLVLLALFLGLLGAIALAHAVGTAERRRRREMGVLRAVGFTTGQAVLTLASMALILACIGAVIGIPLGLVGGNFIWRTMAEGVHVSPDLRIPVLAILLAIPAAAVVAVLVAVVPGWRASRADVVSELRPE